MTELKKWSELLTVHDAVEAFEPNQFVLKAGRYRPGIPEIDIAHAFVRFYRLPDTGHVDDLAIQAARLYWALWLDVREYEAAAIYDFETSFCSNCPGIDGDCCKDTGAYEGHSAWGDADHYGQAVTPLLRLLKMFAGEKALEEARTKVNSPSEKITP